MKGATSVLLGVKGLRSPTYQHCVCVVGVAVGVGRVDRQGHAVREDGEQDEPFEWSAQNGVKENTQRTYFFFFFFLRDFIFKKTLFEKLQYLKQEQ